MDIDPVRLCAGRMAAAKRAAGISTTRCYLLCAGASVRFPPVYHTGSAETIIWRLNISI